MNYSDIARLRLAAQQINRTIFNSAKEIVGWMGAIQAQDYAMSTWAIGVRLPGSTVLGVQSAADSGEILRTHVLRPTWHWVSVDDISWMLALTAPRIKTGLKSRHNELGIDAATITKSIAIFETALSGGRHLTREDLKRELTAVGIDSGNNRLSHLLAQAELDGIICSGAMRGAKQTYALLCERAPARHPLARDEALAALASRYFFSHGPATLQDFAWWSGLGMADARDALELVKPDLISETIEGQPYWFQELPWMHEMDAERVYLLPAFDEYIIAYRDRRAVISSESFVRAVSENGVFRPVIVKDGQVTGIWRRTIKKDRILIETELFGKVDGAMERLIEKESLRYEQFLLPGATNKR